MSDPRRPATLARDQAGATAVEYGILVAAMGVVLLLVASGLVGSLLGVLDAILEGMLG